ncbi:MAG: hypothetical protein Ct9H90mP11_10620 [Acidimicrobiales bacterium]|nr:MAG: hypothetical protein Ct9H90mP11_10620 [Acidimicrobiales bacterium]
MNETTTKNKLILLLCTNQSKYPTIPPHEDTIIALRRNTLEYQSSTWRRESISWEISSESLLDPVKKIEKHEITKRKTTVSSVSVAAPPKAARNPNPEATNRSSRTAIRFTYSE